MTLLSLQGVGKRYGAVVALEAIDLLVARGSRTAIIGPSGSGKTTLLRLIAGYEAPGTGRISLEGSVVADGPAAVPAHLRGIGVVTQDGALFPHLSVADNIGFGLARSLPGRDRQIEALLDKVELPRSMRERRPHELSGGQQQRVALARALACQPRLMLLDEPFSALDAGLRESMRKAVGEVLHAAGITAVLVTHDQAEALTFADQVAILRDGRLVQAGSPQELYARPRDRATAAFLGNLVVLPARLEGSWADCDLGRVATDAPEGASGHGEIMLRPEQLHIEPIEGDEPRSGCHGRIIDIEFGGTASTLTVAVLDGRTESPLLIRRSSLDLPPVGSLVRIVMLGRAHVFEAIAACR